MCNRLKTGGSSRELGRGMLVRERSSPYFSLAQGSI